MSDPYIVKLTHTRVAADLRGISPQALQTYLKAKGWGLVEGSSSAFNVWAKDQFEVMVPLRSSHSDYYRRIHEALQRAAEAMDLTAGHVYFDVLLQASESDKETES
jgi:hypothetical protein